MKAPVSFLLIVALVLTPLSPITSNPVDPEVIAGAVDFADDFEDLLEITQHSDKAIIHWEGFSIDHGEITRFIQPGSSAAVLNRVISGDTSQIEGALEANGKVLLINPNGILIGAGARVDTNGFTASTLDVPDAEFLAGGDMRFSGASQAPVVNLGEITAANGDVFLVGATVQNSGNISAPNGTVGLAAGQQVLITKEGDERVFVEVGSNGSVDHSGAIRAAQAELKAAGGNPKAMAVNVSGKVEATGVSRRGGRVYLSAGGGGVRVASRVQARRDDGNGGIVQATGAEVQIDATGDLDASGTMGGEVQVIGRDQVRILGRAAANSNDAIGGSVDVDAPIVNIGAGAQVAANGALGGGLVDVGADELSISENARLSAIASNDGAGGVVLATGHISANIGGSLAARGRGVGNGGFVSVSGGDLTLTATSRLDATGATDGGFVTVDGSGDVHVAGRIDARGQAGDGGFINVRGNGDVDVTSTARLDAGGEVNGGFITVDGGGDVSVAGQLLARGKTGDGGFIHVEGDGDVDITATARLDASGEVDGGMITVDGGGDVNVDGQLLARGETGNGGQIFVTGGGDVSVGRAALLDASGGVDGGFITVEGSGDVHIAGRMLATGGSGQGGFISVTGENGVTINETALLDASGATGGTVFIDSPNGDSTVRGVVRAVGSDGAGGHIEVTGQNVSIGNSASIDASGINGGGQVLIGGDFQGNNPEVRNAQTTLIETGAQIAADAMAAGDAGRVIVWADGFTHFGGHASVAAAGVGGGNGGFIEISGKQTLAYRGTVDLGSFAGEFGSLLLDPNNVFIVEGPPTPGGSEIDDGVINAADGGMADFTITTGDIAAFMGNVMIQANNDITDNGMAVTINTNGDNISFMSNVGSVRLNNSTINSGGGDVNFEAPGGVFFDVINTESTMPGTEAGDVTAVTGVFNGNRIQANGTDGTNPGIFTAGGRGGKVRLTDDTVAGVGSHSVGEVNINGGNGAFGPALGAMGGNGGMIITNANGPVGGSFRFTKVNANGGNGGDSLLGGGAPGIAGTVMNPTGNAAIIGTLCAITGNTGSLVPMPPPSGGGGGGIAPVGPEPAPIPTPNVGFGLGAEDLLAFGEQLFGPADDGDGGMAQDVNGGNTGAPDVGSPDGTTTAFDTGSTFSTAEFGLGPDGGFVSTSGQYFGGNPTIFDGTGGDDGAGGIMVTPNSVHLVNPDGKIKEFLRLTGGETDEDGYPFIRIPGSDDPQSEEGSSPSSSGGNLVSVPISATNSITANPNLAALVAINQTGLLRPDRGPRDENPGFDPDVAHLFEQGGFGAENDGSNGQVSVPVSSGQGDENPGFYPDVAYLFRPLFEQGGFGSENDGSNGQVSVPVSSGQGNNTTAGNDIGYKFRAIFGGRAEDDGSNGLVSVPVSSGPGNNATAGIDIGYKFRAIFGGRAEDDGSNDGDPAIGGPVNGPIDDPGRVERQLEGARADQQDLRNQADDLQRLAEAQFNAALQAAADGDIGNFQLLQQQAEANALAALDLRNEAQGLDGDIAALEGQLAALGGDARGFSPMDAIQNFGGLLPFGGGNENGNGNVDGGGFGNFDGANGGGGAPAAGLISVPNSAQNGNPQGAGLFGGLFGGGNRNQNGGRANGGGAAENGVEEAVTSVPNQSGGSETQSSSANGRNGTFPLSNLFGGGNRNRESGGANAKTGGFGFFRLGRGGRFESEQGPDPEITAEDIERFFE